MLSLTVYGIPIPQGSTKAFMRPGMKHPVVTADNVKTKPWRQAIVDAARSRPNWRPSVEGPVEVRVVFYLPRPKSAPRRVAEPAKKPDLDKLLRAVCDALTAAAVWRDDAQVVLAVARKAFAGGIHDPQGSRDFGVPRARIEVSEASEAERSLFEVA